MEMRVHLKVCEGCGSLWFRSQAHVSVYCVACESVLKDFPAPASRKRRGRPVRKSLVNLWAAAQTAGGAQ